jgi:hypothetical protein
MGGIAARVPVAITTATFAVRWRTFPFASVTSTFLTPAIRPIPRTRAMCSESSHGTEVVSSQLLVISSLRANTAATSSGPVETPGTRWAAAMTSPGRMRTLLGMQPQ